MGIEPKASQKGLQVSSLLSMGVPKGVGSGVVKLFFQEDCTNFFKVLFDSLLVMCNQFEGIINFSIELHLY